MERTSRKIFNLSPAQVSILLVNVHKGAQDPDVGFEDADNSLAYLTRRLQESRSIRVQRAFLESALWSCNLMSEQGKYWSLFHKQQNFDRLLQSILREDERFDYENNLILKKEPKR